MPIPRGDEPLVILPGEVDLSDLDDSEGSVDLFGDNPFDLD
jgi:hypothetical protein